MKILVQNRNVHLLVLFLLSLVVIFYNLGESSYHNGDEAMYALAVKEILRNGDWLTLQIEGENHFNKPPLIIWIDAIMALIFGYSEFSIRIASAIFGLLTVIFTYFFAEQLFGRRSAFISALIMLTCSQFIYVHSSRTGEFDSAITFFILLSLYFAWKSREKRHYLYFSFGCMGLIAMTKSIVFIIPMIIIPLHLLVNRRIRDLKMGEVAVGFGIFLGLAMPWHIIQYLLHGSAFIDLYLLDQVVGRRVGVGIPIGMANPFFFVDIILRGFYPWSIIFPFGLIYGIGHIRKERGEEILFLFLWALVVFIICNCITAKFNAIILQTWYILPIYPALAIFNGKFLSDLLRSDFPSKKFMFISIAGIVLHLIILTPDFGYNPFEKQSFKSLMEININGTLLNMLLKSKSLMFLTSIITSSLAGYVVYLIFIKPTRNHLPLIRVISRGLIICLVALSLAVVILPLRFSAYKSDFHKMSKEIWSSARPETNLTIYGNNIPGYKDYIYLYNFKNPERNSSRYIGLDDALLQEALLFPHNDMYLMEKQHFYDIRVKDRFRSIILRPIIEQGKYVVLKKGPMKEGTEEEEKTYVNLIGDLRNNTPEVRRQAALGLGRLGKGAAVPSLIFLLNDRDQGVVSAAARALSDLRATASVQPLKQKLSQTIENGELYHTISLALAYLRDRSSLEYLVKTYRENPIYPLSNRRTSTPWEFSSHDEIWTAYLLFQIDSELARTVIFENLISYCQHQNRKGIQLTIYNRMLYQLYRIDNKIALQLIEGLLNEGDDYGQKIAITLLAKPPGIITKMTEEEMDKAQNLLWLTAKESSSPEIRDYAANILKKYHKTAWMGW